MTVKTPAPLKANCYTSVSHYVIFNLRISVYICSYLYIYVHYKTQDQKEDGKTKNTLSFKVTGLKT
jgi:hypothetical protein